MVFSTDMFLTELKRVVEGTVNDITNDVVQDAITVAGRLKKDDDDVVGHMQEIGQLAEVIANTDYDGKHLLAEFNRLFYERHGQHKHQATALDAMKIITHIDENIEDIAPHLMWLFEDADETIPSIFRSSFITSSESQTI